MTTVPGSGEQQSAGEAAWPQTSAAGLPVQQTTGVVGQPTAPNRQILLTIVTLGIWAIVWTYHQHKDIKAYSGEGVGETLGVVIAIFAGIVTPFLLANEVETKLYGKAGEAPPVNTSTGFYALIPIVGGIMWYLKVQDALNRFWVARGATMPA